jgi:hypothetical protein
MNTSLARVWVGSAEPRTFSGRSPAGRIYLPLSRPFAPAKTLVSPRASRTQYPMITVPEHIADFCSVAKECADLWPRIASNAGTVV